MSPFSDIYRGKRVLLTGHTGFKGSWLSLWLAQMGAEVTGFSIDIPTTPSLFELARVGELVDHRVGDVRDMEAVQAVVEATKPDVVFHLAAQPLVRLSYVDPVTTVDTNVMGTVNVLEAVRGAGRPCAVVVVTSDKCYHNDGRREGYRESDPMGGHDPYSMSKGAAELVVSSWRGSYFHGRSPIRLASGRAGNVIGGGDWAADRILTDCVAALGAGKPIEVRNPLATRPWQHVLEPLSGYLWLGHGLLAGQAVDDGWNFGPDEDNIRNVGQLVDELLMNWGEGSWKLAEEVAPPKEAMALSLDIEKAKAELDWRPVWDFSRTIRETVGWYRAWHEGHNDIRALTAAQIDLYAADAAGASIGWAARPQLQPA